MHSIRSAPPGSTAQESAITLLADAVKALRAHPRDPNAVQVASRITRLLANFPTHFVVEFLQRDAGGRVTMNRVPLSDWPDWSQDLGRQLDVVDPEVTGDGTGRALPQLEAYAFDGVPMESLGRAADPDQDTLVPGDGDDAIEALKAIAEQLGVECTQETIEEAIAELQAMADERPAVPDNDSRLDLLRMLWLVVREAGARDGVGIPRDLLAHTDWSRAHLAREDDVGTGDLRLRALLRPAG